MANKKKDRRKSENQPDKKPARFLYIPKDVDEYTARKLQMAIRVLEKELYTTPDSVDIKKYVFLLEAFEKKANEIKRNTKKRRKAGVEQSKLENSSGSDNEEQISF